MTKRRRIKVGNVYAIPLPNSNFAFGRRFKDSSIGIYEHIGEDIEDLPKEEKYDFIVGIYDDVLKSGDWPLVDNRSFRNEDDSWPPPTFIIDAISGEYSIYYKGDIQKASKEQCGGLERTAVWEGWLIIDRIMGNDSWKDY
ncbi:Imm26 family immunity protein [Bacillus spongiae]|uniref:Imm26 family immunity protein n=1 Tax=Bacillus spongiae TaxID=2683610 RepID=A0ABU8HCL2_9BACI